MATMDDVLARVVALERKVHKLEKDKRDNGRAILKMFGPESGDHQFAAERRQASQLPMPTATASNCAVDAHLEMTESMATAWAPPADLAAQRVRSPLLLADAPTIVPKTPSNFMRSSTTTSREVHLGASDGTPVSARFADPFDAQGGAVVVSAEASALAAEVAQCEAPVFVAQLEALSGADDHRT